MLNNHTYKFLCSPLTLENAAHVLTIIRTVLSSNQNGKKWDTKNKENASLKYNIK